AREQAMSQMRTFHNAQSVVIHRHAINPMFGTPKVVLEATAVKVRASRIMVSIFRIAYGAENARPLFERGDHIGLDTSGCNRPACRFAVAVVNAEAGVPPALVVA